MIYFKVWVYHRSRNGGIEYLNVESYSINNLNGIYTAIECLFAKRKLIKEFIPKLTFVLETNRFELEGIEVIVKSEWDHAEYTEKRYRNKLSNYTDLLEFKPYIKLKSDEVDIFDTFYEEVKRLTFKGYTLQQRLHQLSK